MGKHTYKIKAENGNLYCFKNGVEVLDWCFLKGENMAEMKLFVDGVGVATRSEIVWEGLTDAEYNNIMNGVEIPKMGVEWSKKEVDAVTGEITITAKRDNGETCITVLDKDCVIIREKCKVIKP